MQLVGERAGRYDGGLRATMETQQMCTHHRLQPADAIVRRVIVKTRMEAARDWDAQRVGDTQRRPSRRSFGGDVHRIRALGVPATAQFPPVRQSDTQPGIARHAGGARADQFDAHPGIAAVGPGPDHLDAMLALGKPRSQGMNGGGDAIDLRRPGFGDEGDMHDTLRLDDGPSMPSERCVRRSRA